MMNFFNKRNTDSWNWFKLSISMDIRVHFDLWIDRKIFRSKEIDNSCQFDETFIYKYIRKFERKLIDVWFDLDRYERRLDWNWMDVSREFRGIKIARRGGILWNSARGGDITLEILIKPDRKADHVRESRLYSSLLAIPNNVCGVYENSFIYFPAGSWDMNWMFLKNAPRLCRICSSR